MPQSALTNLSETAVVVLGAFAMADLHTLSAADIEQRSAGAISAASAARALEELSVAGYTEMFTEADLTGYRLTRSGIEVTLQLQHALAQRHGSDSDG